MKSQPLSQLFQATILTINLVALCGAVEARQDVDLPGGGGIERPTPDPLPEVPSVTVQTFLRGDVNDDGAVDLSDSISTLGYLFSGTDEPACFAAAKATGSAGELNITDAVFIFTWLFSGGDDPPPPTPSAGTYPAADCGPDPLGEEGLGCLTPAEKCSQ